MAEQTVQVKLLDRKHPDWILYHDAWDAIDLLYEGGVRLKNNVSNFIIKRPKELYDVYQERCRRFTYQPILPSCIGWYLAKLFQKEPQIEPNTTDERFHEFLQDCDRAGTTFMDFTRSFTETMMLYWRGFVLIDKPQPGDIPVQTRADEKQLGLNQPYVVLFDPRSVFNWDVDEHGNLEWITIKIVTLDLDGPLGQYKEIAHWYVYDRQNYSHYEYVNPNASDPGTQMFFNHSAPDNDKEVARLVDTGRHVLAGENRVPVRVCELPKSLRFTNRAYLHLMEHLDVMNGFSWKLYMANHPQLVIQTDTEVAGQTMSEVSYVKLSPNDKIHYLEPDGKSFDVTQKQLSEIRQEIYRDFHLTAQGRPSSASADGASGYSKEQEMAPANDMLNAIGDIVRANQQLILLDYKVAAGLPVDGKENEPNVNGYRFETKPILQDVNVAQAVIDTGLTDKSETLEKVMDRHIAASILDGENEETKEKVYAEIEKAPTRKEVKDQAEQQQMQVFQQRFQKATANKVLNSETESVAA